MQYEYDPNKSAANKLKHGLDFDEAKALWDDDNALMLRVDRPGEERHIVIGHMFGTYWTAVITFRGENIRIISVRRARKEEVMLYEQG
ncbi:BrnT family toxin [Desulfovibrio fairfieldensis]|uniref:Toxin n=1 Tax=Desulfovibrio fairfieldensis TaxID=44742 RepID=A0A0X8JIK7_9BACT|nr:BrnT family toxin [Desulfovibrio fairfieldensis]AMD89482.1 toxin [Desulfovibrio fairfieldensis]